jgi:hypothetical protein
MMKKELRIVNCQLSGNEAEVVRTDGFSNQATQLAIRNSQFLLYE